MKKKIMKYIHLIYFVLLLLFIFHVYAAEVIPDKGQLRGTIIDGETHQPLENVTVRVVEINRYQPTDSLGRFIFNNLNIGLYTIEVSRIGYKTSRITIHLAETNATNTTIIHLYPTPVQNVGIVITGEHIDSYLDEYKEITTVLRGQELQRDMGFTLAAALRNETGLSIRSMGPAPARPLIRGLGGDRILITEDGIKTNDLSATSPDHAVTVEPFTVERIEVVRGPKILLHSPTTIGGIVNIIRDDIPKTKPKTLTGNAGLLGETAMGGYIGALVFDLPWNSFVVHGELSKKGMNDLRTPLGKLKNSDSRTTNYSTGLSYLCKWGFLGGVFREYVSDYGVPGGVVGTHPNGVDISLFRRQMGIKMEYIITQSLFETFEFDFSRTFYRHTEYEYSGLIGAEFSIINYSGRVQLKHGHIGLFQKGTFGASMETRDFKVGGFVFTPASRSYNAALFAYENGGNQKTEFEIAGRLNYDYVDPSKDDPSARIGHIRDRKFLTYSLALSLLHQISENIFIGANVNRSSRTPSIEELYSEGPHLAAYSYEVGNPDLREESGFGIELFSYYKSPKLFITVTGYRNDVPNYIVTKNTGLTNYSTLLPVYASKCVHAVFTGIESEMEWKMMQNIKIQASGSYTYGLLKETNKPLPMIPPFKGRIGINFNFSKISAGAGCDYSFSQKRTDEFEQSTAGYLIGNAFIQYTIPSGSLIHTFTINGENLFDSVYRNHLSRLKSMIPESGRNFRVLYRLYF